MNIIVKMKFGSHLYGLNTPESDTDYKSIYLPTKKELLLGTWPKVIRISGGDRHEKNTADDVDEEAIALPEFIAQACKGETYALDMLHCTPECLISSSWIWDTLVYSRRKFYSKDMKAYIGYLKKQVAKYGVKSGRYAAIKEVYNAISRVITNTRISLISECLPKNEFCNIVIKDIPNKGETTYYNICGTLHEFSISTVEFRDRLERMLEGYGARVKLAERNEGIDWKAVSHALRAGYQLRDIFIHGDFEYPLSQTGFLLKVKKGELHFMSEVSPILESLLEELEELSSKSTLPNNTDTHLWDKFLLSTYDRSVLNV